MRGTKEEISKYLTDGLKTDLSIIIQSLEHYLFSATKKINKFTLEHQALLPV